MLEIIALISSKLWLRLFVRECLLLHVCRLGLLFYLLLRHICYSVFRWRLVFRLTLLFWLTLLFRLLTLTLRLTDILVWVNNFLTPLGLVATTEFPSSNISHLPLHYSHLTLINSFNDINWLIYQNLLLRTSIIYNLINCFIYLGIKLITLFDKYSYVIVSNLHNGYIVVI